MTSFCTPQALPPWFKEEDRPDVFDYFVSLDVDLEDLRHAADEARGRGELDELLGGSPN